jgi:ABC-2 type transport system permease protein
MTVRLLCTAALTGARNNLSQRGSMLTGAVFYLVVASVLSALWRAAVEANGGELVGYTAAAVTWYALAAEAATVSLNMRMIETVCDDISSGAVAVELLRPAPVLWLRVAWAVGAALPKIGVCCAMAMVIGPVAGGAPPRALGLVLALPSLVLAVTCNVVAQHAVASVAFWVRDIRAVWFVYQKIVFVLGGMLLPLQVLPDALERVAFALPFMAMAYAPSRLASGHVEPWLLLVQLAWLGTLAVAAHAAFGSGERRLQVVGG